MEAEEEEVSRPKIVRDGDRTSSSSPDRTERDYTTSHLPHLDLDTHSQREDTPTTHPSPLYNSLIDRESHQLLRL